MEGYIPIWRSIFATDEWRKERKFSEFEAWLDMIAMAAFAERSVQVDASTSVTLSIGEIYASQRQLAKRWGWSVATVNRYLARLASGSSPRIRVETRRISVFLSETQSETQSETPNETVVSVMKLVNYEKYNSIANKSDETPNETQSETQSETIINKYIELSDNNTHTQIIDLVKFFAGACDVRTREQGEELADVAARILRMCQADRAAYEQYCKMDAETKGLIWLWGQYPHLQLAFTRPLNKWDLANIRARYEQDDIERILEAMANKLDTTKRYYSAYLTFKDWANRDFTIENKRRLGNARYTTN
jgi:hypothetical protein